MISYDAYQAAEEDQERGRRHHSKQGVTVITR